MATDDLKARLRGFATAWRANRQNGDEIYEINHHAHGNQCVRASDLTEAADAIATLEAQLAARDAEIAAMENALSEAIEWDGYDDEGVPAVWLKMAQSAINRKDEA